MNRTFSFNPSYFEFSPQKFVVVFSALLILGRNCPPKNYSLTFSNFLEPPGCLLFSNIDSLDVWEQSGKLVLEAI